MSRYVNNINIVKLYSVSKRLFLEYTNSIVNMGLIIDKKYWYFLREMSIIISKCSYQYLYQIQ